MITVSHLSKTFYVAKRKSGFIQATKALFKKEVTPIQAIKDISFSIKKGEMVGYIGPNGAGKSTTIKMMCGILTPDSGLCTINGMIPWKDRKTYTKEIGVVFGQRSQLWWDVPVADSFELLRDIYEINPLAYEKTLQELVELLDLHELLLTPARSLSLGQRMRCEIAASLIHEPTILFLDEPTIGLDAVSKIAVREFIKKINQEKGTTVILTTHDMQDIEALTQRVILIGHGKILLDGNLSDLKQSFAPNKRITLDYLGHPPTLLTGMTLMEQTLGRMLVEIDEQQYSISKAIAYFSEQCELTDLSVSSATTEELVTTLYKEYQL